MKTLKLAALTLPLLAATALSAAQTNLVQTLQIGLVGYMNGATTTNGNIVTHLMTARQLSTVDIMKLLGDATSTSLSRQATLVSITPLPDGDTSIVIRDGAKTVDVTEFFTHTQASTVATRQRVNIVTGATVSGAEVSVDTFILANAPGHPLPTHFNVSGFTRSTFSSVFASGQPFGEAVKFVSLVSGTGDIDGTPAVFQGAISVLGQHIEVDSQGGGGIN